MVEPYLNFSRQSQEAIDFYETVFSTKNKQIMRYKDAPPNPAFPMTTDMMDLVLHAEIEIEGTRFHFSDTQQASEMGNAISMAITVDSPEIVMKLINQLKENGALLMAPEPTFFSPMYGWVKDKFGMSWQIISK